LYGKHLLFYIRQNKDPSAGNLAAENEKDFVIVIPIGKKRIPIEKKSAGFPTLFTLMTSSFTAGCTSG
jgi:hypothetical protein